MDSEKIIGCICGMVGLFGIGYAIGASSKLKSVSDAVNKSVDSIIADGKVDIPKEMINETIQNNVKEMVETTSAVNTATIKVKKHSPEILIVAGVVGTVASAVMACKATTKLSTVLEEHKKDVNAVHECSENEEIKADYSQEDAKKDLTIIYAQTGVKLVKLYAPAIALGALSITSIVASNNILRKRNVALAAAYATVDKSFKEYRNRVVERFGEQVDKELKYDIKAKKFEETVKDPETGKEKKVKSTVNVANADSGYAIDLRTVLNYVIDLDTRTDMTALL